MHYPANHKEASKSKPGELFRRHWYLHQATETIIYLWL